MCESRVLLPENIIRRLQLCQRCKLYTYRKNVVPGRGTAPADVLFIGEGPGRSENIRGLAFIGPTKRIMDAAVETASQWAEIPAPSVFFTNTVCCRPCDGKKEPNRPPTGEEVWACYTNIDLIAKAVAPKLVIFLGLVARDYYSAVFKDGIHLVHPAFINYLGGLGCPEYVKFVRGVSTAFKYVFKKAAT